MNSRYWGTTLIKLLNLTNSVYNFNNNGSETGKNAMKTAYWRGKACWQVIVWPYKPCEARDSRHVDRWARELASHVDTWVHKHAWDVDTLAREHLNTQGILAHEHVSTQGTLAREQVSM